ncbi:MAG: Gfo/Idh/MocA family oxidoreductase [Nitrospirae bacterium]|nr:Gfo/Idh/MocA family oxidoreductase [Nitrospirota bacterium]
MGEKIYRAAIIGCGRVAWILETDPLGTYKPCTHAGAYRLCARTDLVAGADIRVDRRNKFAGEFQVPSVYHDYREMLEKDSPDIVSICAYAPQRRDMVLDAIEAGVKGIWCEKALATSLEEADEIVDACSKNGVSLIVSHMRRWDPVYILAKKIIDDGEIGEPVSAVCHFSSSMLHTGTHAFDVLRFFFGEAVLAQAFLEAYQYAGHHDAMREKKELIEYDVGGYALLSFNNGVYVTVHGDSKGYFLFEFDILGTEGRIRIGNWLFEVYRAEESKTESGLIELSKKDKVCDNNLNVWTAALEHLIDCMEGKAKNVSGPEDGRAALEIGLAIHESSRNRGKGVRLPLQNRTLKVISR